MNTSRRGFVKGLTLAGIGAVSAPFFVQAADKSDSKKIVTGKEAHRYEVIDDWAKLPAGYKFGNTHGVAEAGDGRIIVHHQGGDPDSMAIFDPDGKFIKSWGPEWRGGAHGLQLRKEADGEYLYLAVTSQHVVLKTDLEGKVVFKIEYPKEAKNAAGQAVYQETRDKAGKARPAGATFVPTNIAFHPSDGSFYVADGYGSNYIHQYSGKGEYQRTFGGPGTGDGQLRCPHGIWCDTRDAANPLLVVADRSNERLHYFTLDGKFARVHKPQGNAYRHPCHFDQRGEYLLVPGLHGVVSILDKNNEVYAYLGDNPDPKARGQNGFAKEKLQPGIFVAPHGACFTKAGDIYVGEWLRYGRVTKLRHVG